jgi:hypothetical protein
MKVEELQLTVDYDAANVAGRDFLLPSAASLMTRLGSRHLVRNEMRFSGYRRFETQIEGRCSLGIQSTELQHHRNRNSRMRSTSNGTSKSSRRSAASTCSP